MSNQLFQRGITLLESHVFLLTFDCVLKQQIYVLNIWLFASWIVNTVSHLIESLLFIQIQILKCMQELYVLNDFLYTFVYISCWMWMSPIILKAKFLLQLILLVVRLGLWYTIYFLIWSQFNIIWGVIVAVIVW